MDRLTKAPILPAALVTGFAASTSLWVVWFVAHLPWLKLPEAFNVPLLLSCWVLAFVGAGRNLSPSAAWRVGLAGGLISALVGLLLLGSKLRASTESSLVPSEGMIAVGFLGLGMLLGVVGCWVGSRLGKGRLGEEGARNPDWLSRFAWVTVAAAAPLLFVGGLVTSTNSGMAVPDWPNTFGTNMFLYPLGPRSEPGVYLEHAHRLFGTLVGLAVAVLAVWTCLKGASPKTRVPAVALPILGLVVGLGLIASGRVTLGLSAALAFVGALGVTVMVFEPRGSRKARLFALGILAFVIVQGWLGGLRVVRDERFIAIIHGVSAQLILAALVMLAAWLSPVYRGLDGNLGPQGGRRLRGFATAAFHTLLIQLVFGAMYRHMRSMHVLWTHAGFATIVLITGVLAGFAAAALAKDDANPGPGVRSIRGAGRLLLVILCLQFVLGWVAFMAAGQGLQAESTAQALIRTAHQANGALLAGVTAYLFTLSRRATPRGLRPESLQDRPVLGTKV